MGTQLFLRFQNNRLLRAILRPVNLTVFQVMQRDPADRYLLILQCLFSKLRPQIGRTDNQALGKRFSPRSREEAVDILFLQAIVRGIELALDGMNGPCAPLLCHQIDAVILGREAMFRPPFGPSPNPTEEISIDRLVAQIRQYQILEVCPLFSFAGRASPQGLQQGVQRESRLFGVVFGGAWIGCERG